MLHDNRHAPASVHRISLAALLRPPAFVLMVGLLFASRPAVSEIAYVWANEPTAASYQPDRNYAYNPAGGPIEISRESTGIYRVRFVGMDLGRDPFYLAPGVSVSRGNVQVTAYGRDDDYCKVGGWVDETINIRCFDNWGALADGMFTALFSRDTSAYVLANDSHSASYTPAPDYNRGGIEVNRTNTGRYWIRFAASTGYNPGVFHVTAYGNDNRRCQVQNWFLGWGGRSPSLQVRCFSPRVRDLGEYSTDVDSRFTVLFSPAPARSEVAVAWNGEPTAATYVPTLANNPTGGGVEITRDSTGSYRARFAGMNLQGGNVQVTATACHQDSYGDTECRCKVAFWARETIAVRCFDNAGTPVDAGCTVMFTR